MTILQLCGMAERVTSVTMSDRIPVLYLESIGPTMSCLPHARWIIRCMYTKSVASFHFASLQVIRFVCYQNHLRSIGIELDNSIVCVLCVCMCVLCVHARATLVVLVARRQCCRLGSTSHTTGIVFG
jgi:hypothetical protein